MTRLASLLSKLHLLGRQGKSPTASASAPEYIAPLTKRAPSTAYVAPCQKTANTASHPAAASRPRAASCQHSPRSTSQSAPAHLSIPCPAPTLEERTRDTHQNRALRLVRQEDWATLSHQIRQADTARNMTPGGMSVADLMAFGARADVVLAAEHALLERTPPKDAPLFAGIEALEFVLDEHAQDYVVACIVAQAHIDLAWAWRGIGWDVEIAPRNREAFEAHLARARGIVAPFSDNPDSSTLLAGSICAMLRGKDFNSKTMADRYEALIDLNPYNTAPLRALGVQMLPRWHGSYDALELEARRTAARTSATWGAGGYVWVMFDAISVDDTACARLDLEFFTEGLRDIIARRPDPHTVILLAAYCANTMGNAVSGNDGADLIRTRIANCAEWIVREHLTELHPMIWAHAAQGFANNLRVASANRFAAAGHEDTLRILTGIFKPEIAEGKQIVFTEDGPKATAA